MLKITRRIASPLTLAIAFIASGVLLALLFDRTAEFENTIGKPSLPDTTLPPKNLYDAAGYWSRDTVDYYITEIAPLDFAFPVALGLTLAFALVLLSPPASKWPRVGLFAMFFDWAENASFVAILSTLGSPIPGLAPLAMALTSLKFALYIFGLGAVIYLFLIRQFAQ